MVHRALRWAAATLAAVVMLTAVAATAAERDSAEISRITGEVSEAIESPYCPGQSLAMCPSANAAQTRQDIQQMAREGMDADEIKDVLLERYGAGYELIEPPMSDQMTLLGGIIGGLAIAIGAVGLLVRRQRDDEEDGDNPPPSDDVDDDLGDDELYLEELRAEYQD